MFCKKRSQAAFDFLFSYAGAIFVVIVAITTLTYFGISNESSFFPSKCILAPPFPCTDMEIKSGPSTIELSIWNRVGYNINAVTVSASRCSNSSFYKEVKAGEQKIFTISGCLVSKGQRYTGDLNFSYVDNESEISHKLKGSLANLVR